MNYWKRILKAVGLATYGDLLWWENATADAHRRRHENLEAIATAVKLCSEDQGESTAEGRSS